MIAGTRIDRWELRFEPDRGTKPIVALASPAGHGRPWWRPEEPIIGAVRWYCNGEPAGEIRDGYPSLFG
jgi:hypothetical protein